MWWASAYFSPAALVVTQGGLARTYSFWRLGVAIDALEKRDVKQGLMRQVKSGKCHNV
jgi:hypothetical protein